jgi:hypothetical protein
LLSSLQLLPLTSFLINRMLSYLVSHWFFCCCLSSHNFNYLYHKKGCHNTLWRMWTSLQCIQSLTDACIISKNKILKPSKTFLIRV